MSNAYFFFAINFYSLSLALFAAAAKHHAVLMVDNVGIIKKSFKIQLYAR